MRMMMMIIMMNPVVLSSVLVPVMSATTLPKTSGSVKSIPDELNKLMRYLQPQVRSMAQTYLPETYGNCYEDGAPPTKCQHAGNLYFKKTSLYRVKARWITGINDLHMRELAVSTPAENKLDLKLMVELVDIPMSLRLEACAWGAGCTKLWDNQNSCCGKGKRIWATLTAVCSPQAPYIRDPVLSTIRMDKITVSPKLFGSIKVNIADITNSAENGIKTAAKKFLSFDIIDGMNNELQNILGQYQLTCQTLLKP